MFSRTTRFAVAFLLAVSLSGAVVLVSAGPAANEVDAPLTTTVDSSVTTTVDGNASGDAGGSAVTATEASTIPTTTTLSDSPTVTTTDPTNATVTDSPDTTTLDSAVTTVEESVTTTVDSPVNDTTAVEVTTDVPDSTAGTAPSANDTLDDSTDGATTVAGSVGDATDSLQNTTVLDDVSSTQNANLTVSGSLGGGSATGSGEDGGESGSSDAGSSDSDGDQQSEADSEMAGASDAGDADGNTDDSTDDATVGASDSDRLLSVGTDGSAPIPVNRTTAAVGLGALTAAALVHQFSDGITLVGNSGVASSSAATVSAGASSAKAAVRSRFEDLWRLVAPFRYSSYDDSDPLNHRTRATLHERIERSPGTYLSELTDRVDVPVSTAKHHLDVLEKEGLIMAAKVRGKRRFYPAHAEDVELTAAIEDSATAAVLHALARLGDASGGDVADELGRDASTVSHHLSRLEDAGLIEREREGRAVVNRLVPEVRATLEGRPEVDADTGARSGTAD
ncbi:helix-turn-helix domain-containing protein [Halorussus halophilus]|uniref:helix-turn-helix domain-containing protein n=1 Tax=Halorussus halophilus TaxID=2650975 RepID=UPI0013016D2D|nr:helix-turn-helix domain-containing protein [Halorussus halophilus]